VYSEQSVTQWDNVSTGASMSSYGNRRVRSNCRYCITLQNVWLTFLVYGSLARVVIQIQEF